MLIWQKLLTEGKQIGIDVEYKDKSGKFDDDWYNIYAFHPDLQIGSETGWVHVGATGGNWLGCLMYLYKNKFIDKNEYCDLEYRYA